MAELIPPEMKRFYRIPVLNDLLLKGYIQICRHCLSWKRLNRRTGELKHRKCEDWECLCGKHGQSMFWLNRTRRVDWTHFITVTTFIQFSPWGIKKAQRLSALLIAELRRSFGIKAIVSGMAVNQKGMIHYHILIQGNAPTKKWLREFWFPLTGCYEVDVRPAGSNDGWYLVINNVACLPDIKDDPEFPFDFRFKRIRATRGLFPPRKKKASPNNPWRPVYFPDAGPISDEMQYSPDMNSTLAPGLRAVDEISSNGVDHGPPRKIRSAAVGTKAPLHSKRSSRLHRRQYVDALSLGSTSTQTCKARKKGDQVRSPRSG